MTWRDKLLKRMVEMMQDNKGKAPSTSEQMELSKLVPAFNTNVRLEARDALTGKLTDLDEGHNFLSIDGKYYLQQYQKLAIAHQYPNVGFPSINLDRADVSLTSESGLWKWLYLTDSGLAESPNTELDIPGTTIVGYANKLPYSGTDQLRGAVNQNESFANNDMARMVFDFSTDRANGVIQSVGLCRLPVLQNNLLAATSSETNIEQIARLPRNAYVEPLCIWNNEFYYYSSGVLYKINLSTLEETAVRSMSLSSSTSYTKCAHNGNLYWVSANVLYKHNLATGVTINIQVTNGLIGVATDGNYLYVVSQSDAYCYRRNLETLANEGSKNMGLNYVAGVLYYNNTLYVINYVSTVIGMISSSVYRIHKANPFNYETGVVDTVNTMECPHLSEGVSTDGSEYVYVYRRSPVHYNGTSNVVDYALCKFNPNTVRYRNMITRKRLDAPIVKNNSKTLKVTYDIIFS